MAHVKAKHPRNIPAGYYKPIGQLIVRWGFTELYVQSIVWHVWKVRDPKAARALTWHRRAEEKLKLFRALAPRWIKERMHQDELVAIHSEANRLRRLRNRFAHGVWGYVPGRRKILWQFYLSGIERSVAVPKATCPTVDDLKQCASDLDALNIRLKRFHRTLGAPTP